MGILVLAACAGGSNKYMVTGEAEGLADGTMVYLCSIVDGVSLEHVDSVAANGGRFKFAGETDTCDVGVINFDLNGQDVNCTFFLEPGKIRIGHDGQNQHVSGTATNDGFQAFIDKMNEIDRIASDIDSRMRKAESEGRNLESYQDEMHDLQDSYMKLCFNSIKDNADNLFGYQQLLDCYSMFEPDELDELIKTVEPHFKNSQTIAHLRQIVDIQLKTSVGSQYQDFAAKIMKGEGLDDVRLSDYVGKYKVVLLDFWASWCGPCINEIPHLKDAYAKYKSEGFEIVSVSVDEDQTAWREAVRDNSLPWAQLIDTEASTSPESPASLYAINTIPASFLIDSDGTIIAHNLRGAEYIEVLSDIFKDK